MHSAKIVVTGILFGWVGCAAASVAAAEPPGVISCVGTGYTGPGIGPSYSGRIRNDDYSVTAAVPHGLVGWGGVADSAPFHGFIIYLDGTRQSCIQLEIHLRVNEEDRPIKEAGAKSLSLGKAKAWQVRRSGTVGGVRLVNVATTFTFQQPDQNDDGVILLISPQKNMPKSRQIYKEFVRSIIFGKSSSATSKAQR